MTAYDVDVLFDDGGVLVVDKPAGLALLPGQGFSRDDTLWAAIAAAWDVEPALKDGPSFLGRLDRPTSGIVVAALTRAALAALEPAWRSGAITKDYLCVVHGKPKPSGDIDVPLAARRPRHRGTGRVEQARTSFERLAHGGGVSLVRARLHTGRTHQIRRHMKAIGHPLLGDDRYGDPRRERDLPAAATTAGLLLHAWRLQHDGALAALPARVEAPMPARFTAALAASGVVVPALG